MYNIAYIEPYDELLFDIGHTKYLGVSLFDRIDGIKQAVFENRGTLQFTWLNTPVNAARFIEKNEHLAYDGIILGSPGDAALRAAANADSRVAIIVLDETDPGGDCNCISFDHHTDAETVTGKIIDEGDIRICLVVAKDSRPYVQKTLNGFEKAFKKNSIPFNQGCVIGWDLEKRKPRYGSLNGTPLRNKIIEEIAKKRDKGVFVMVDPHQLRMVYQVLTETHKFRIPQELKIVSMRGYGVFPSIREEIASRVAMVGQDYKAQGKRAIALLLDILQGKRPKSSNKILIPGFYRKSESISSAVSLDRQSDQFFKASVANYIAENYMHDISSVEISKDLDLSYNYFLSKFKESFGCSLADYVNRIRLDKAAFLVLKTSKPLVDIYTEVGFASKATFNRNFKERFTITPSAYRRAGKI